METKICKKCGIEKPLERFGKTNRNTDGYNGSCKDATVFLERKIEKFNLIQDDYKRDYSLTRNKKKYIVTSPDGEEIVVDHLVKFCKENGLVFSTMSNLSRGIGKTCKNWKCRIYNN